MSSTAPPSAEAPAVPPAVTDALRALRSPIVISHVVPDADALGSVLALARAWGSQKVEAKAALPEGTVSKRLTFLCGWADAPLASDGDFAAADGFVVLDTAKKSRCNVIRNLKGTDFFADRPIINIDHHETSTRFGTVNWIAAEASSTAELVYALLASEGWEIDAVTASLLYAGIQTDTLGFSLPTTTASALRAAADLVARGAAAGDLGERLYRSQRKSEFDLLRVVYANTRVVANGRIAYSSASYDEIHDAGCTAADIDDQINVPRSLEGVQLAMLFSEGRKGKVRINFRGSGDVTVVELANEFGGGGHSQAAGAILDGTVEEAVAQVVPRAEQYLREIEKVE